MNDSSPSPDTGRARRLIVTVLIGTAAAAVTARVVLNERQASEAVVPRAAVSPALAGGVVVSDPSLPTAAEALKGAGGHSGEDAPTF